MCDVQDDRNMRKTNHTVKQVLIVTIRRGAGCLLLRYHKGCWQNSYWFQARILNIHGEGQLAAPAQADILVLDEDTWPNNIPSSLRGGKGLSLLKYFIQADRHRRGRKWWKTMIAMVFLPVHSVPQLDIHQLCWLSLPFGFVWV